jgi:hypothetical protein
MRKRRSEASIIQEAADREPLYAKAPKDRWRSRGNAAPVKPPPTVVNPLVRVKTPLWSARIVAPSVLDKAVWQTLAVKVPLSDPKTTPAKELKLRSSLPVQPVGI